MRIEWDERKNRANIRKHGLDFTDTWEIFGNFMLAALDDREDYGEDRWIGTGRLRSLIVVVVYTEPDEDTIRIISLRKGQSYDRIKYEKALKDQLGMG